MPESIKIEISKESTQEIITFAQRLLGPLVEATDFLSDKIRYIRWKSAMNTLLTAKRFIEQRNLSIDEVPVKFLVPFIEKASLEKETSQLTETWAELLVTAINAYDWKLIYFTDILSKIGHEEVKILQTMWNYSDYKSLCNVGKLSAIYGKMASNKQQYFGSIFNYPGSEIIPVAHDKDFGIVKSGEYIITCMTSTTSKSSRNFDDYNLSEFNIDSPMFVLEQLGLVKIMVEYLNDENHDRFELKAILTPLGYSFINACRSKTEYQNPEK